MGWVGPAITLGSAIIGAIGGRRERNATNRTNRAEDIRLEQEARRRAQAKAALMRGIMDSYGYGGMMTDPQMVDLLTRTERRGAPAQGSVMSDIGRIGGGVGRDVTLGYTPIAGATSGRSAEFWDWLDQIMLQGGGAPAQPARDIPRGEAIRA